MPRRTLSAITPNNKLPERVNFRKTRQARRVSHGRKVRAATPTGWRGAENGASKDVLPRPPNLLASKCMHLGAPGKLWCRDKQIGDIRSFISSHLKSGTPGSMYISGTPGTGKTASIEHLLQDMGGATAININCMSPQGIYTTIAKELGLEGSKKVEEYLSAQSKEMIVMVLDEVDQLKSECLHTVFGWPLLPNSRLILIGIANTLDLLERLPRLQPPQHVMFPAFTKAEIEIIITERLKEQGVAPGTVMHPMAIRYAAGKAASLKGDIRYALDLCRRAMESNHAVVLAKDIMNVLPRERISLLSDIQFQHQVVVCALVVLARAKCRAPMMCSLHERYATLCTEHKLSPMSEGEVMHVVDLLESNGIVSVKKSKVGPRFSKVSLCLDEAEVANSLQHQSLLGSILKH